MDDDPDRLMADLSASAGVYLGWYVLDDDHEPRRATLAQWITFRSDFSRSVVARDRIRDVYVSTVFLGLDHSMGEGRPVLFETMTFGGAWDQRQWRYTSWGDAKFGHAWVIASVREGPPVD